MVAAANKAGLNTGFVGENLSTGLLLDPASLHRNLIQCMSMADVKQSIYAGILAMIYQDVENSAAAPLYYGFGGHTEAFLNDPKGMNGISYDDNGNQYMTVTIDKDGWVHYNFFDDGRASQAVKNKLAQGALLKMLVLHKSTMLTTITFKRKVQLLQLKMPQLLPKTG